MSPSYRIPGFSRMPKRRLALQVPEPIEREIRHRALSSRQSYSEVGSAILAAALGIDTTALAAATVPTE